MATLCKVRPGASSTLALSSSTFPSRSILLSRQTRTISPRFKMSSRYSSSGSTTTSSPVPLLLTPSDLRDIQSRSPSSGPKVVTLDATWFMPNTNPPRDPLKEFKERRIPGSRFYNVDQVAEVSKEKNPLGLPHMLPDGKTFSGACSRLGIDRDSHVVVYDTHSVFSSPRTAFTFKAFGHEKVSLLDGGLPRWLSENLPTETGEPSAVKPSEYPDVDPDPAFIRSYEQMVRNSQKDPSVSSDAELVLDARAAGRFHGTSPEPRPNLSSGHIPYSLSLPFDSLLTPPNSSSPYRTFLPPDQLRKTFSQALGGDDKLNSVLEGERGIALSCGSGMTASVLWYGLWILGAKRFPGLYDESWTGYALRPESNIEKSPSH